MHGLCLPTTSSPYLYDVMASSSSTTSQAYPTMPCEISPQQLCGDNSAGVVASDWYAPSSFAYNEPYMTPFPSSTVESQPFGHYFARPSVPDINVNSYAILQSQGHPQSHINAPGRPRSSPSTFGPAADSLQWTTTGGLGINYTSGPLNQPTPVTSTFPPDVFHTYPIDEAYPATSSPPEIRQPQPRRAFTSIAPNPGQIAQQKRSRGDDDRSDSPSSVISKKQRKRTSSVASADLSEDDRFLVQLKEEESLPWKDIATRFHTDKGKSFQVAALQMRYKRLREKFRQWEDEDLHALKLAHEYWEKYKWEIIAAKMLDFGIAERWPARYCARKWQEMEAATTIAASTAGMTPLKHFTSSPTEGQMHFGFMPIQ